MSTAITSLPGRKGLPRPRVLGILLAAVIVVAVTYVSTGARQAPPTTATAPAHLSDPTTIDTAGGRCRADRRLDRPDRPGHQGVVREPRQGTT